MQQTHRNCNCILLNILNEQQTHLHSAGLEWIFSKNNMNLMMKITLTFYIKICDTIIMDDNLFMSLILMDCNFYFRKEG